MLLQRLGAEGGTGLSRGGWESRRGATVTVTGGSTDSEEEPRVLRSTAPSCPVTREAQSLREYRTPPAGSTSGLEQAAREDFSRFLFHSECSCALLPPQGRPASHVSRESTRVSCLTGIALVSLHVHVRGARPLLPHTWVTGTQKRRPGNRDVRVWEGRLLGL